MASSATVAAPFAIRHWLFAASRDVRYNRVSPCASRRAFTERNVSGAVYPSAVFRSPLSDIVKRKHIRSNRMVEKLERRAVRLVLQWIDESGGDASPHPFFVVCSPSSV
jgi:hypothetical protein